jgi:hypothetical protein
VRTRAESSTATVAIAIAACMAALAAGGCGEQLPDVAPPTPAAAPRESAAPGASSERPELVRRLRRLRGAEAPPAAIVVVDVTGRDLTDEPVTIQFAKDGTLQRLRWSGWGSDTAVGRGSVQLLECNPSCARGLRQGWVGEIRLTHLKRCAGRRFYDAAEVSFGAGAQRRFARSFIGAPC